MPRADRPRFDPLHDQPRTLGDLAERARAVEAALNTPAAPVPVSLDTSAPGVGALLAYINAKYGLENLTPKAVVRLRGKYCRATRTDPASAGETPLKDVAVALALKARKQPPTPNRLEELPQRLSATERSILKLCRRKPMKGEVIARHETINLSYDYIRHVLASLVRRNLLTKTEDGYRTV
jgi:hypothetical protein